MKKNIFKIFILIIIFTFTFSLSGCKKDEKKDDEEKDILYKVEYDLNGGLMMNENETLNQELKKGSIIEFNQVLFDKINDFNYFFSPINTELECFEINNEKYELGSTYEVNADTLIKLIFKPLEGCFWVERDLNGGTYSGDFDNKSAINSQAPMRLYELPYMVNPPEGKTWDGALVNDTRYYVGDSIYITEDSTYKYMWKDEMTLSDFEYEEENGDIIITGIKDKDVRGIQVPSGVTKIEAFAFSGLSKVRSIVVADTVTSIGDFAFYDCEELKYVALPNKLETINFGLVADCESLYRVDIPNTVKRIEDSAFGGCKNLPAIRIPDGIEYIGNLVFTDCDSLEYKEDNGILYYGSRKNPYLVLISLSEDNNQKEIVVNENTKFINTYAFSKNATIEKVILPDNLVTIGDRAFENCTALSEVNIPSKVEEIPLYGFSGCSSLKKLIIPENIIIIAPGAFSDCTGLIEIELPSKLEDIGDAAFNNCSSLKKIDIPATVESIGFGAFIDCALIEEIKVPEGIKKIYFETFEGCINLKSITLPASLEEISSDVFKGCMKLNDITFTGTKDQWTAIKKKNNWNTDLSATTVTCKDGIIDIQ